jgi:hypothetical protein
VAREAECWFLRRVPPSYILPSGIFGPSTIHFYSMSACQHMRDVWDLKRSSPVAGAGRRDILSGVGAKPVSGEGKPSSRMG